MSGLKLYRKRLIPDEIISLDNDRLIRFEDGLIVTKWETLKPRPDFSSGLSCYYLNEGYKISKMLTNDGKLLYYYCDIIDGELSPGSFIATDLLFDVIIYPDMTIRVIDLNEGAEALRLGIISQTMICKALDSLDNLLKLLYGGKLEDLIAPITGI